MFRRILLYGLPVYLYILELFLKSVATVREESLLGPTLAGAGIGFLLPLTDLKPVDVPDRVKKELANLKISAYSTRDKVFVDCVWIAFSSPSVDGCTRSSYLFLRRIYLLFHYPPRLVPVYSCFLWSCRRLRKEFDMEPISTGLLSLLLPLLGSPRELAI